MPLTEKDILDRHRMVILEAYAYHEMQFLTTLLVDVEERGINWCERYKDCYISLVKVDKDLKITIELRV